MHLLLNLRYKRLYLIEDKFVSNIFMHLKFSFLCGFFPLSNSFHIDSKIHIMYVNNVQAYATQTKQDS